MGVSSARVVAIQQQISGDSTKLHGVCFDYFDTVVHRSVSPEYTKVLSAKRLKEILRIELSHTTLYEIRSVLEKKLCEKNVLQGGDSEFNLKELGAELYGCLKLLEGFSLSCPTQDGFVQLVLDIEIAVEGIVQQINSDMIELLGWLKKQDISTYLISDFYIPVDAYRKMLEANKIEHLFSKLFISSEYLATKSSGKLYEIVLGSLGCEPAELMMIGDNSHSDYAVPQEIGIHPVLLETESIKQFYKQWETDNEENGGNKEEGGRKLETKVAALDTSFFPEMGFTLWLFIAKLFKTLVGEKVENVLFCSKEGEFLKKLFDSYQHILYGREIVRSHYFLVSRKATFVCSLRSLDQEDFGRLFIQYRDLSIEEFLLSLNFSAKQVQEICKIAKVDAKGRKSNLQNDPEFGKLLSCPNFSQEYEAHRNKQRTGFLRYLDSFGIDYGHKGLHLVDVGWNGSIQNNIFHTLKEKVTVSGYYIGLLSPNGICELNRKQGLIFTDYLGHTPFIHVYNNNRSLFEMLLGASHGSADGYFPAGESNQIEEERNSMVGVVIDGHPQSTVTTLDLPEERTLFKEQISPLQQQCLTIFLESVTLYAQDNIELPEEVWFAKMHARMVFKPTREEVKFYSNLYHLENFGIFEFTRFSADQRIGIFEKLMNLRRLIKAPEQYLETGVWPPVILRRLGLDLLQPLDGAKRLKKIFGDKA